MIYRIDKAYAVACLRRFKPNDPRFKFLSWYLSNLKED